MFGLSRIRLIGAVLALTWPATAPLVGDELTDRVDRAIKAAAFGGDGVKPLNQLRPLGESAVPRLLHWLEEGHPNERRAAAYAVNVCWSDDSARMIGSYLGDADNNVRELIGAAIRTHASPATVVELASPWLGHRHPAVAGQALFLCEEVAPDADRMNAALADRRQWNYLLRHLPRHEHPKLTDNTLRLLSGGKLDEKVAAIAALIAQHAGTPDVRRRIALLMRAPNPLIRDRCAEYLTWLGRADDLPTIEAAIKTTREPHALASLRAAAEMIQRREQAGLNHPPPDLRDAPIEPARADEYDAALAALEAGDFGAAYRTLALGRAFAPRYRFGVDQPDDEQVADERARLALLRAVHGFPVDPRRAGLTDGIDGGALPVADRFVTPVRAYFNPKRESFGKQIPAGDGPFAGQIHVGDDTAWNDVHDTVVAIAAGRVRAVYHGESWGGLVVIEHRKADGETFCSLYGHLGPLMLVRRGETVEAGRKIGSLGRHDTWANGGYQAHIHFGIHRGDYGAGHWTAGYVSPERFADEQAGWVDPQAFLRDAGAE